MLVSRIMSHEARIIRAYILVSRLTHHQRHATDPTHQMHQLVSVLHQFSGRDTDKVKITTR